MVFNSAVDEHPTAIDFTVSCPLLPSYIAAAVSDASAIFTQRAAEKTKKHADGSAHRGRVFLPWVITTFFGIGPPAIWYFIDATYASSAALARLHRTSYHLVARRKAAFLATLHATLIRSNFNMLTTHTTAPAARLPPQPTPDDPTTPAPDTQPPPDDAGSSRPTTPEPDSADDD